eukprot:TRINITY_DN1053_c0_g1_i7.p1 TRINITY_DN1053_c0_g1~~TRINITY_DN1053_c0_g1_i7.p1  ORF type:complete len:1536 (-),score=454.98 TRINITY_DN1053_c0_g1_i7:5193-9128(-)
MSLPGNATVYIQSNTTNPIYNPPVFSYYQSHLTLMTTKSGPVTGGTTITIHGSGLTTRDPQLTQCLFNNTNDLTQAIVVSATLVNQSMVWCTTPNFTAIGDYTLQIGLNTLQYEVVHDGYFRVYNLTTPQLSLSPRSGLKSGATLVTVSGSQLVNGRDIPFIRMDPDPTGIARSFPSQFNQQGSQVIGTTPSFVDVPVIIPGHTYNTSVQLAANTHQYTAVSGQFFLYESHGIGGVSPNTGPTNANASSPTWIILGPEGGKSFADTGSEITVQLESFTAMQQVTTSAQWLSASQIRFALPSISESGAGRVRVALNGQQYSAWRELTLFAVTSVDPTWISTTGGSPVTVYGHGFNNTGQVSCQFDDGNGVTNVAGSYVSPTRIHCTSPALQSGTTVIRVTTSGSSYSTNTHGIGQVTVSPLPSVGAVIPNLVSAGLSQTVEIVGTGFVNTSTIQVKFTTHIVNGIYVSPSLIRCTTPALVANTYRMFVSLNGRTTQFSSDSGVDLNVQNPIMTAISPASAPVRGDTAITVTGSGFFNSSVSDSLIVRMTWGSQQRLLNLTHSQQSLLVRLASTEMVIRLPDMASWFAGLTGNTTQPVTVHISTNGGATYANGRTLTVYAEQPLTSANPSSSPATTGGTSVIMHGLYGNVGDMAKVRLQDSNGWTSNDVPATRSTDLTSIAFSTPAYTGSMTLPTQCTVWFANNGQQFIDSGRTILMYGNPTITGLDPTTKTPGETLNVTIAGTGFVDTGNVMVRLGTGYTVAPKTVRPTEIVVTSTVNHAIGEYAIQIALDGQSYATAPQNLEFSVAVVSIRCPNNAIVYEGAQLISNCECRQNFYSPTGQSGVPCEPCPINAQCSGRLTQPAPLPGFFSTGNNEFTRCATLSACLGGSNSTCANGYTGRLCGSCAPQFFRLGETCQPCQQQSNGFLYLLVLLFIMYLVYVRRAVRSSQRGPNVVAIAITHLQIISTFGQYRLEWPDQVSSVLNLFSFANLNLESAQPECSLATEWTFEIRFWVTMMVPVVVIVGLLVRMLLEFARESWVRSHGQQFLRSHESFCAEPSAYLSGVQYTLGLIRYKFSLFFTEQGCGNTERARYFVNETLFSLGVLYISISEKVLAVFDCTTLGSGVVVLDAAPDEQCWVSGGMHERLLLPAAVFGVLFVIGLPALLIALTFFGHNGNRDQKAYRQMYSSVFVKYRGEFFWFEGVVLVRKLAIVGVKLFATTLPTLQGLMGVMVIGGATVLQSSTNPYSTTLGNRLELILFVESLLILISGLVFVSGNLVDDQVKDGWTQLTVVIGISIFVVCFYYLAKAIVQ